MVSFCLCNVCPPTSRPSLPSSHPCRIGDWYPERNIFQLLIALTAGISLSTLLPTRSAGLLACTGPRFAIVFLQYSLHLSESSSLPTVVFLSGIVRTLSCGGWVYITSSDDHDIHDFMMILYMVCNIPWMLVGIATTPRSRPSVLRKRQASFLPRTLQLHSSFH